MRLRNISAGGAMVECEEQPVPGTRVELDLEEAGTLEAEVRWSQRGQVGLHFAEAFSLGKLARKRRRGGPPEMLMPQYLGPQPDAPERSTASPLATKKRQAR